jgi:hypothetical protein
MIKFIEKTHIIEYSDDYVFINISNNNQIIIIFYENKNIKSKLITLNEQIRVNQNFTNKYDKYQIIFNN